MEEEKKKKREAIKPRERREVEDHDEHRDAQTAVEPQQSGCGEKEAHTNTLTYNTSGSSSTTAQGNRLTYK